MNNYRTYLTGAALLLMLMALVLALPLQAAQDEAVGRALLVVGTVEVVAADGSVRRLSRRDPLYEGETIRSASNGRAQIRFTDGARMSIRPDSELAIDDYEFAETAPPAQARSSLSLRRGGFRTATGAVAQRNRSAYRVSTPFAVIGVRGTDWSAAIADVGQGDNLFLGVNDGGINAENNAGNIDLGDDGSFNFARIRSFDEMPEGLRSLPTRVASTFSADDLPATDDDGGEDGGDAGASTTTDEEDGAGDSTEEEDTTAGATDDGSDDSEEGADAVADTGEDGGDGDDGAVADTGDGSGGDEGDGTGPVADAGDDSSGDVADGSTGSGGDDADAGGGVVAGAPDAGAAGGDADGGASGEIVVDIGPAPAPEGSAGLVFEVTTNCF